MVNFLENNYALVWHIASSATAVHGVINGRLSSDLTRDLVYQNLVSAGGYLTVKNRNWILKKMVSLKALVTPVVVKVTRLVLKGIFNGGVLLASVALKVTKVALKKSFWGGFRLAGLALKAAKLIGSDVLSSGKKHLVTLGGVVTGFCLGAVVRVQNGDSLFTGGDFRDCIRAFPDSKILKMTNKLREERLGSIPFIAGAIVLFGIQNVMGQTERSPGVKGLMAHVWKNLAALAKPLFCSYAVYSGAWNLRSYVHDSLNDRFDIDTSGHAIIVASRVYLIALGLDATRAIFTPAQQRTLKLMLALRSLTDIPWTYHTIRNCHSIADIAVGVSLVTTSWLALKLGCVTVSEVWKQLQPRATKVAQAGKAKLSVVWNRVQPRFAWAADRAVDGAIIGLGIRDMGFIQL